MDSSLARERRGCLVEDTVSVFVIVSVVVSDGNNTVDRRRRISVRGVRRYG